MAWADLTTIDAQINGLFSCIIFGFGIVLFLHLFARYWKTRRPDTILTAVAFLTLGSAWLGGVGTFVSVILTGQPLEPKSQVLIFSWAPPLTTTLWTYLGFRLVKPRFQYYALGVLAVMAAIHLFGAYVLVPRAIPQKTPEGETDLGGLILYYSAGNMSYTSYRGYLFVVTTILVLSASMFVGLMFLRLSRTTDRPETRARGLFIGVGAILFGSSVIIDEIFIPKGFFNVLSHLDIVLSMVLLYCGYILPPWLKRRINLD